MAEILLYAKVIKPFSGLEVGEVVMITDKRGKEWKVEKNGQEVWLKYDVISQYVTLVFERD